MNNDYTQTSPSGGVTYVLDGHPLPLWGALVYLMYEREIETPEEAEAYLDTLTARKARR